MVLSIVYILENVIPVYSLLFYLNVQMYKWDGNNVSDISSVQMNTILNHSDKTHHTIFMLLSKMRNGKPLAILSDLLR